LNPPSGSKIPGIRKHFRIGCCPLDTTFPWQREYTCVPFETQGCRVTHHLLTVGVATAIMAAAGSAFAADMPVKAPPPAYPAYDWGGMYIGGVIGGAWGETDSSDPNFGILGARVGVPVVQPTFSSGFIGGVEGGLRYQLGKLVVGTEADITWGSVNGTSTTNWVPLGVLSRSISADTNWIATATSSIGIAHNNWLIYTKAGVAYAHTNYTDSWVGGGIPLFTGADSENRVGWTVGAGIEWAICNNWSVKAEYDYLDFGNQTVAINGTVLPGIVNFPASFGMENAQHINQFKAGLNWRILPNFW
jgi:outer membrane immunogenic protein